MKKKILIIDDELNIRVLCKEELEDEGYVVEVADNAENGFLKFKEFNPDIVILDIKMPGESGLEILQKFKTEKPKIPVILYSAYPDFKNEFVSWAADDYIVKSLDFNELKEAIKKFF